MLGGWLPAPFFLMRGKYKCQRINCSDCINC